MKKSNILVLILTIVSLVCAQLNASETIPVRATIVSSEYSVINGTFNFVVKYLFTETVTFGQNTEFDLPVSWTAIINPALSENTYNKGDSIFVTITVHYSTNILPYFAKQIKIKQFITEQEPNLPNRNIETFVSAMIYFTPYNTIEIWSLNDFYDLPRRWHYPHNTPLQERIFVSKNSVPISNINVNEIINWYDESKNWDNDNRDDFREVKIPGLAYSVLMNPIPSDSIEYYDNLGDGTDSISTKKTFTGTVKGRLTASLWNDIGIWVTIPLSGISVKLREADWANNQTFGETFTNDNGEFSFYYSESQLWEGDYIELFLEFKSFTNNTYSIESSNFWGNRFEERTSEWSAPQYAGTMTKNHDLMNTINAEPFKAIHWARRGFQYFERESVPLQKNLRIKPFANGSWYDPALIPPIFVPTIHLESGEGYRENTTYHEFGHFTMHRLQNNNFTIPYGEDDFNHSWKEENTSLLAWAEAWANAVQMILDAVYWQEDGEYARDEGYLFEDRRHFSWEPFDPDDWRIVNGFRSEYYIACAIYDLWDGSGKGLPSTIPGLGNHGWNDTGQENNGWRTEDDVEISFYHICKPLKDHPSGNGGYLFNEKIRNVQDYYKYLLANMAINCKIKSDISRVFKENRVQWNIPEYEWGWHSTNLSSDFIHQTKQKYEDPSSALISNWTDFYLVNFHNDNLLNEYRYSAWPSQDLLLTDNLDLGIWDNSSNIFRQSNLYLNDAIRPDYTGWSTPHGNYQTCGDITIDIRNGKLELGGANTTATFTVNEGSTLIIREYGSVIVNNNSTLIIECGANIVYEDGASIELIGENSQLIIKGNLEIGSNAIFTFNGSGSLTKVGPSDIVIPYPNSTNSKFVVESGTSMTIVAKNSIRLKPGFHAKQGCSFRAYIDPYMQECEGGTKSSTLNTDNPNIISQIQENPQTEGLKWEITVDTISKVTESKLLTRLIGSYPNPNSDYTIVKFKIGEVCPVKIFITNTNGIKIHEILSNDSHPVGEFEVNFSTLNLDAGVYFYTLQTDKYFQTKRMVKQ